MAAPRTCSMSYNAGRLTKATSLRSPHFVGLLQQQTRCSARRFATSTPRRIKDGGTKNQEPFRSRLLAALRSTKLDWSPVPIVVGIAFLGAFRFYRVRERERKRQEREDAQSFQDRDGDGGEQGRPKKRKRIRPSGPWYDILLLNRLTSRPEIF